VTLPSGFCRYDTIAIMSSPTKCTWLLKTRPSCVPWVKWIPSARVAVTVLATISSPAPNSEMIPPFRDRSTTTSLTSACCALLNATVASYAVAPRRTFWRVSKLA
jgi:hypothetical protein